MYEGLFRGISDADEVAALVDAVGPGLRPRPGGQVVEEVAAVVIRVGHPEATLGALPRNERRVGTRTKTEVQLPCGSAATSVEPGSPGPDVGG